MASKPTYAELEQRVAFLERQNADILEREKKLKELNRSIRTQKDALMTSLVAVTQPEERANQYKEDNKSLEVRKEAPAAESPSAPKPPPAKQSTKKTNLDSAIKKSKKKPGETAEKKKRQPNCVHFFKEEMRPRLDPQIVGMIAQNAKLTEMWNDLDEEEKQPYKDMAREAKDAAEA